MLFLKSYPPASFLSWILQEEKIKKCLKLFTIEC